MSRQKERGRPLNGVLLLDKPSGMSSNQALQHVKRLYRARKAGHTGSLDPLATGMLAICFGEATKLSAFLLDADKTYRLSCRLGQRTETGDAEGKVLESRAFEHITMEDVQKVIPKFRGEIEQVPPMYSALKHQGKRLYELAREGKVIERQPRAISIYRLDVIGLQGDILELEVECSKGTYVRTLAEDIGEALGCGAYITELRRLGVGPFSNAAMHTLDGLRQLAEQGEQALDALLLPMDSSVAQWPEVTLNDDTAYYLRQGQAVIVPNAPTEGWVRIYSSKRFLGVGEVLDDGRIAPRRMVAA